MTKLGSRDILAEIGGIHLVVPTERKEGIDYNVILSEFKIEVIRKFVENYKEYKRRPIIDNISPSKIIVDSLIKITAKD